MVSCLVKFRFRQCIRICAVTAVFAAASVSAQTPAEATNGDQSQYDEQRRLYLQSLETARMEMQAKMQRSIIPEVSFDQIRFAAAIEVLRRESIRLDQDSPPNRRGIKISVEPPPVVSHCSDDMQTLIPETASPLDDPGNVAITLRMDHPSLMEVLGRVGRQVGLLVKVDSEGVQLVRCHVDCQPMIIREFNVPPAFIRPGSYPILPGETEEQLKASGVQFPPGASATYLNATRKLGVRNTEENIDLIDALEKDFMSKPAPTPTPSTH